MKSIKAYLLVLFQRALKLLFIFRPPPSGTALEPCDLLGEPGKEDRAGKQEENDEGKDQGRP
ncbi:MAG: hypothetical protein AB7W16_13465 [Candidatus Obscuribacterales bacterium]